MIVVHVTHGDEKALSQNDLTPRWYASGFAAIHFLGAARTSSSELNAPQDGQVQLMSVTV